MELSSFVGRMATLKNEFSSILPKSTDTETAQSKTNQVFMILTLLKLETKLAIPKVGVVATKVEDNVLISHTATEWVTLEIDITRYMAALQALLIWPSPLIHLCLRFRLSAPPQGTHPHLASGSHSYAQ